MEEKRIGIEIRSINNLIKRFMESQGNKKEVDRITGTNGWIIGFLADNKDKDIYQKDLEEEFCITRSTASRVIKLMVKKNLIEQRSVSHDARLKKLVLTPRAEEVSNLMKEDAKRIASLLTKGFSEEEITDLYGFLLRVKANIPTK